MEPTAIILPSDLETIVDSVFAIRSDLRRDGIEATDVRVSTAGHVWHVHSGDAQYDTWHDPYCGAGSIGADDDDATTFATAMELVNDALDMMAEDGRKGVPEASDLETLAAPLRARYVAPSADDPMVKGYVDGMLFANVLREGPNGIESVCLCSDQTDGRTVDVPPELLQRAAEDVRDFRASLDYPDPEDANAVAMAEEWKAYLAEYGEERAGTDFALSRNGHGSGFFARGDYDRLQRWARSFGSATWGQNANGELSILE